MWSRSCSEHCPMRPGCTRVMAQIRRSASSGRTSQSGVPAAGRTSPWSKTSQKYAPETQFGHLIVTPRRLPLVREDREVELGGPLPFEELVLHQAGLLAHAEATEQSCGRRVALVDPRHDAMQADHLKAETHHLDRRLGGVSVAAVIGIEHVSEFTAAVQPAMPKQHHVTHEPAGLKDLHAEGECLSLICQFGARPLCCDALGHVVQAHRSERNVATYIGPRPVRDHRL